MARKNRCPSCGAPNDSDSLRCHLCASLLPASVGGSSVRSAVAGEIPPPEPRRAPRPPSPARGVLAVVVALVVGAALVGGAIFLVRNNDDIPDAPGAGAPTSSTIPTGWQEYTDPAGHFRTLFPNFAPVESSGEGAATLVGVHGARDVSVIYSSTGGQPLDASAALRSTADGLASRVQGTLKDFIPLVVGDYQAADFRVETANAVVLARVILTPDFLYLLQSTAPVANDRDHGIFVDSFVVLP